MEFVAQETCGTDIRNTSLFESLARAYTRPLANLNFLAEALPGGASKVAHQMHIHFDFTCNVIVTAVQEAGPYRQAQVSAYDGHVYPLPDLEAGDAGCTDCWRRRNEPAALAYFQWQDHGQLAAGQRDIVADQLGAGEVNCGLSCSTFAVEEWWPAGGAAPTATRRLVGRGVHNGTLAANASEVARALTLDMLGPSYSGSTDLLVGLGECCVGVGCLEACREHDGELLLFAYGARDLSLRGFQVLPGSSVADAVATQLRLAVLPQYWSGDLTYGVSAWIGGQVQSFNVTVDEAGAVAFAKAAETPEGALDGVAPLLWAWESFQHGPLIPTVVA